MAKKGWIGMVCTLLAVPVLLAGCGGQGVSTPAEENSTQAGSTESQAVSAPESAAPETPQVPDEPFTAADGSFSVVVPQGFAEQTSDAASGTTMWMNPRTQMVLVATSVPQGLQADALTKEAMEQTLSAAYEQAAMNRFEQREKDEGDLFVYDAKVTQNERDNYIIQALYTDEGQTVTLVMTVLEESQVEDGWAMIQTMTESLKTL